MTMYEKYIEIMEVLRRSSHGEAKIAAYDAAIELMRAAEFKDAAAEREHCESIARTIDGRTDTRRALERERAQARAEGYLSGTQALFAADNERSALGESNRILETELAVARARATEVLERERALARADGYAAGRTDQSKVPCVQHGDQLALRDQLAAAQAEIAKLKTYTVEELETRLNNLRAAAERCYAAAPYCEADEIFRIAIEASK